MLANTSSLYKLASDPSYERRHSGPLQLQQVSFNEEIWIYDEWLGALQIAIKARLGHAVTTR